MDRTQVALAVMAKISGRSAAGLEPDMELVAHLGIDSPKALQLLADLEDALGVEISDEAAARMETVGDVLDHVASLG